MYWAGDCKFGKLELGFSEFKIPSTSNYPMCLMVLCGMDHLYYHIDLDFIQQHCQRFSIFHENLMLKL